MNIPRATSFPALIVFSSAIGWFPRLTLALNASAPKTLNGCECKKTWAEEGIGSCDNFCCAPDQDPAGKWCMVLDPLCEDADWGYCMSAAASVDVADCRDMVGWRDSDGDTCATYGANQWCSRSGKVGPGWHEDWGDLGTFTANGFTAFVACCVCGGGQQVGGGGSYFNNGALQGPSSARYTYNGCQCKEAWEELDMSCSHACCNPDGDPAGVWCMVVDHACEEGEWGYCRPAGSANPSVAATSRHGHCNDMASWKDVDGEGCEVYTMNAYCTDVGGYGLGWNMEWGTFGSFAQDGWTGADEACCACGGGTRDQNAYPQDWEAGAGTEGSEYGRTSEKVRTTWTGCECKETWNSEGLGNCNNYCCNPDEDPVGSWCMVKDTVCEDSDWGYCQTSGFGTLARPLQEAHNCQDVPFWRDPDGDGCKVYKQSAWCASTGGQGPGWHEEWGKIQSFSKDGHTGLTACCACGGGNRVGEQTQTAFQQVKELLGENIERMWEISSGNCKMNEKGCITSGNYPENYDANEECQIAVDPALAKPIEVKDFDTEFNYDALKVNGELYSGERGPAGIIPTTTIHWGTDAKDQKKGWMLCPRGEVVTRNPAIIILKILGIVILLIMCTCCCAIVALWVRAYRNRPTGDGLGAGPTKIGKKYAQEEDA